MNFLKKNIDAVRIVGASSIEEFFTWVDAAYAVHEYMKIQIRGTMFFGNRTVNLYWENKN